MKKTTFLVFTITIAILTAAETNAQSFDDIFNISHNIFSEVDNDLTNSNIKSNKMSLTKIYLAGPPIELGKFRVIYNAEYKRYQNDFESRDGQKTLFADNLNDIRLTTIFNYKLSQKWALNYVNFSTIKSDFNNFSFSNAYKGINAITAGYSPKGDDSFRYGFGITHSKEMGELSILPVAFIYYKTDKWLIDLMYPRLNVFRMLSEKLELGFMINYDIGAFDVEFDKSTIANMEVKPEYQTTTNLTFTPQVNYYFSKNINIYARAGLNLMSEQGLMDGDFNEIKDIGYESEKMVPTFGFGLTYKIPHNSKN